MLGQLSLSMRWPGLAQRLLSVRPKKPSKMCSLNPVGHSKFRSSPSQATTRSGSLAPSSKNRTVIRANVWTWILVRNGVKIYKLTYQRRRLKVPIAQICGYWTQQGWALQTARQQVDAKYSQQLCISIEVSCKHLGVVSFRREAEICDPKEVDAIHAHWKLVLCHPLRFVLSSLSHNSSQWFFLA